MLAPIRSYYLLSYYSQLDVCPAGTATQEMSDKHNKGYYQQQVNECTSYMSDQS